MSKPIRKSSRNASEFRGDQHRFEHWYVDNQVYFITARVRDRYPAFATEQAKSIFWDRFDYYTAQAGFEPWITTLIDNHYHTLGYIRVGMNLKQMMQRIHGSVAKLVNDLLETQGAARLSGPRQGSGPSLSFWRDSKGREYFDGCIRDATQYRRAYRYTLKQSERHKVCPDHRAYPHTHVTKALEEGLTLATKLNAFMEGVPYKRYLRRGPA